MNRLWLWVSVVIFVVVLIVMLFPIVSRSLSIGFEPRPPEGIPFDERNPELFRESIEKRAWTNLSRSLALGAIIGLLAGVLITRWLVEPLRQLEKGANAMAKRQWDYRVPERGSAEIRSVANSFNQMAEELERQENLRSNMLADVTHELRHPVHILQGNLQAILDGVYPLSEEEIARLYEQTQNLAVMVEELHELSQAEAQQLPLLKREVDLVNLVQNTGEAFLPLFEEKQIKYSTELPSHSATVEIDADRVRQAITNLLGNALRYTPGGGEVQVRLGEEPLFWTISVIDSGSGIKPEDLQRVFDRFYRADAARSREIPGTGLGLAIAQAIIQAHEGVIAVTSGGVNQGSTFTIKLPKS